MSLLQQMSPLVLYCLKRDFGAPIDIYKLLSSEVDPKTGVRSAETHIYRIKRAIVMPAKMTRAKLRLRGSSNKDFINLYDETTREFIIEQKDARGLTALTPDDWIVHKDKKWQVASVEDFEVNSAWVVTTMDAGVPQQTKEVRVESVLSLNLDSDVASEVA